MRLPSPAWAGGLVCGALFSIAPALGLAAAILLLPAVPAVFVETDVPSRPLFRAVLFASLAGALPTLSHLWMLGASPDAPLAVLRDVHALALAWAGGALGWAAAFGFSLAWRAAVTLSVTREATALTAEREALTEEYEL